MFRYCSDEKMRDTVAHEENRVAAGFTSADEQAKIDARLARLDWAPIKAEMRRGLDDGVAEASRLMADHDSRKATKTRVTTTDGRYGGGANLDWHALEVKGTYMAAVHGGADHEAATADAKKQAAYLAVWRPLVDREVSELTTLVPSGLAQIPARPPELSSARKQLRALTPQSAAKKRATIARLWRRQAEDLQSAAAD